jgi:hypothetical protein
LGFAECTKAFVHFSFQPPFDSCIWRPWNSHHWSGVDFALVRGLLVGALNFSSKASLCSDSLGPQHRLDCFPLCCSSSVRLCLDLSALKRFQYLVFTSRSSVILLHRSCISFRSLVSAARRLISVAGNRATRSQLGVRSPSDFILPINLQFPVGPSSRCRHTALPFSALGSDLSPECCCSVFAPARVYSPYWVFLV